MKFIQLILGITLLTLIIVLAGCTGDGDNNGNDSNTGDAASCDGYPTKTGVRGKALFMSKDILLQACPIFMHGL